MFKAKKFFTVNVCGNFIANGCKGFDSFFILLYTKRHRFGAAITRVIGSYYFQQFLLMIVWESGVYKPLTK
jgi:hypothetical protein